MISYGKQFIDQSDIDAVVDVMRGDWLTQGPKVQEFENDLKHYFGTKYVCAVSNGTAALHLAGIALGWTENDIIITSPITFLATANSIEYSGAKTVFVDIDKDNYTIDLNQVESKIKECYSKGQNVKAVIGIDFAGHPCDWVGLRALADKYDLQLINDNCHALGAHYNNQKTYAGEYADIVTQSYHPVKHITTGEGGSILTNDISIYNRISSLRTHGMTKDLDKMEKNDGAWYYEMIELGFNYRITDIQSALGSSQLKKLDSFIQKRSKIADKYNEHFSQIESFIIPSVKKNVKHAYHLYPIQINFEKLVINKSLLFDKMKSSGINLQVHYIPVHLQPYYRNKYGYEPGDFLVAEKFYEKEVSLPIYPTLDNADVSRIITDLTKYTR